MQHWQWIQLNVGLVRHQNEALSSARKLFAALEPLIQQWREAGQLQHFFFMRKPPDVRLRFFTHEPQMVLSKLTALADDLLLQGIIHERFFSEYEPEGNRFGGSVTLTIVHTYFDVDTTQWLRLDRLKQQRKPVMPEITLLTAVLHDLFQSTLMSSDEMLLTWHTLRQRFELPIKQHYLPSDQAFVNLQALQDLIGDKAEIKPILYLYHEANRDMAQQLKHLWNAGTINCPLPDLLANVGQFTLHRHGFDWFRAGQLIGSILEQLEERRSPLHHLNP